MIRMQTKLSQRFQVVDKLLRAMDRRDPWTAADLVDWMKAHYPDYLRNTEPEHLDPIGRRIAIDVYRAAIEELRSPDISEQTFAENHRFLGECYNDYGSMFSTHEVDAALFALSAADQIFFDPAFPLIVRNLLNIAAECMEIDLKRIEEGAAE